MDRTITIKKDLVFYHAEAAIRKALDVRQMTPSLSGYHLQPDRDVGIDKELLHRIIEFRDAIVRTLMVKYLKAVGTTANDNLADGLALFVYELNMPTGWRNAMLQPLATYIHNYLVQAALFDYLKDKAPDLAAVYGPDLAALENDIENALAAREGIMRRPLRPF